MNLPRPASAVLRLLSALRLGTPRARGPVAVWPLLRGSGDRGSGDRGAEGREPGEAGAPGVAAACVPLAEACARGFAALESLGPDDAPGRVHVTNRGAVPVLVLFGEQVGDEEGVVANASFLVAARSRLAIDVSRLARPGAPSPPHSLTVTGRVAPPELRRRMAVAVAEARAQGGRFDADQEAVWECAAALADAGVHDELEAAFPTLPRQVGFVAVVGEAIAGVEMLADAGLFAAVGPRLLAAYGAEALDRGEPSPSGARGSLASAAPRPSFASPRPSFAAPRPSLPSPRPYFASPQAFLAALGEAPGEGHASLGLGRDLRFTGGGVGGFALESGGRIVHLFAFPHGP